VAIGFYLGAAIMAIGGIVELVLGVKAEGQQLEDIAKPLTAEDAEGGDGAGSEAEGGDAEGGEEAGGRPREEAAAAPGPSRRSRDLAAEERAHSRDIAPGRRYRLGPSRGGSSPGMLVSAPVTEVEFSREVGRIEAALAEHGPMERAELARSVGARFWGPGRYQAALREAVVTGRAHRLGRTRFGPGEGPPGGGRFRRGAGDGGSAGGAGGSSGGAGGSAAGSGGGSGSSVGDEPGEPQRQQ